MHPVHYLFLHQTILLVKGSAGSQWVLVIKDNGIGPIGQPRPRPFIFIIFLIFSAFSHEKTGTR
jgi:hypothetical protein